MHRSAILWIYLWSISISAGALELSFTTEEEIPVGTLIASLSQNMELIEHAQQTQESLRYENYAQITLF